MPARALTAIAVVVATLPLLAAPAAGEASGYQQVVDLTFPADPRVTYTESYDAGRSGGRVHKATDLMGDKGWAVYAAVGGVVTWIPGADGSPMPSYGYMVTVDGDDGREYSYVHLNNDTPGTDDGLGGPRHAYAAGLRQGTRVERGQLLGWIGDSGNAESTAPHVHFEIEDPAVTDPYGTHRIDPRPSLDAARARDDYAGAGPGRPAAPVRGIDEACPEGTVPDAGFADVAPGSVHARPVSCIGWWEIAGGQSPDRYAPALDVTRGQLASFIARFLDAVGGTSLPKATEDHFEDDDGNVHEASINRLAEVGIVTGTRPGAFEPRADVTRAQMATFLVRAWERAAGRTLAVGEDYFVDDDATVHATNIAKAADAGLAAGARTGYFEPGQPVTRGQMASFLARSLALLVAEGRATLRTP